MEHYKDRESTVSGTSSDCTVSGEKLKGITNVASGFSTFFIAVTEKLNIEQKEKGDNI